MRATSRLERDMEPSSGYVINNTNRAPFFDQALIANKCSPKNAHHGLEEGNDLITTVNNSHLDHTSHSGHFGHRSRRAPYLREL
jgi:hypothetical protein